MSDFAERFSQGLEENKDTNSELGRWLSVSGDLDDFIFFDQEEKLHSER